MAPQSKQSVPTVFGLTATTVSKRTNQTNEIQRLAVVDQPEGSRSLEPITISSRHDDVPLAALTLKLKSNGKKRAHPSNLTCERRPNLVSYSSRDNGGYVYTEEIFQRVPWSKMFATGCKDQLENRHKFCCMMSLS